MVDNFKDFLEISVLSISVGQLALFFGIILVFQILRRLFVKIVIGFLHTLTKKTKNTFDDGLLEIIDKPLRFIFSIIGLYIAFTVIKLPEELNSLVMTIIQSLFIYAVFWALYRSEKKINEILINKFAANTDLSLSFLPLFSKTTRFAIFIIGSTIIIQLWGYNIGAIITGLGIGGLAVALAAKDTLANFFGSLMIVADRPFRVGDWVICDGVEGTVEDIGFRTTKIRTFAKALVSVPNANISTTATVNYSMRDRRRIKYSLGVTYSASSQQMRDAVNKIEQMLTDHEMIYDDGLMVYFDAFADSSMNIFVYCFTKTAVWTEYLAIRQDVNLKIMEIFETLKIDFAFPSMSIYMENDNKKELY